MKAEIIQAQMEIIQGYYNRIVMQQPDLETIIQWLEDDLQTIRMDDIVLDAENIINAPRDPHEVSKVKCDVCNYSWVAVRPLGLTKLECPQCGGLCSFENEM
jgi:hypothetical protein